MGTICKTELLIAHIKNHPRALHTMPFSCSLLGTLPISMCLASRKLHLLYIKPRFSLPSCIVLLERLADHSPSSVMHSWSSLLQDLALPSLSTFSTSLSCTKLTWKKSIKIMLRTQNYCPNAAGCKVQLIQGRICPQWLISIGDRQMLQHSNFKVCLLVGCKGLESDSGEV